MRIIITGVNGRVGYDIARRLYQHNTVIGVGRQQFPICPYGHYIHLNLTYEKRAKAILKSLQPDIIIHCAAWTNVQAAQLADNVKKVYNINVNATKYIAEVCKELDIPLVYFSTDYVFNETNNKPISPDCKHFNPLNVYGKTKLQGEDIVSSLLTKYFIIRISWVFGGIFTNFVTNVLEKAQLWSQITVTGDQFGRPTYTRDLANEIAEIINTDKYGYYHITNSGEYISWAGFCEEIYKQTNIHNTVLHIASNLYNSEVKRPLNSRLDTSKLIKNGFSPMPDWKDALSRYLNDYIEKYKRD